VCDYHYRVVTAFKYTCIIHRIHFVKKSTSDVRFIRIHDNNIVNSSENDGKDLIFSNYKRFTGGIHILAQAKV